MAENKNTHDPAGFCLNPISKFGDDQTFDGISPERLKTYQLIRGWVKVFLMSAHPELGRPGPVCPFTPQSFRLDTIILGVSDLTSPNTQLVTDGMRYCFAELEKIPCTAANAQFRTIIIGFPGLNTPEGIQSLNMAIKPLTFYASIRGRMYAVVHPQNEAQGIWNQDFRPLKAPIPMIAIRQLVLNDTPFVIGNLWVLPYYLFKYPISGPQKIHDFARKYFQRRMNGKSAKAAS